MHTRKRTQQIPAKGFSRPAATQTATRTFTRTSPAPRTSKGARGHAFLAVCLALLPLLAFAAPATADEGLAGLQVRIEQLQRDVDAERQLYDADQARHRAWEASAENRLAEMRAQARRARSEADSLARVLASLGSPTQNRAVELRAARSEGEAFAQAVAGHADAVLEKLLREELPDFAASRERALRDLARGLRTGVITPEEGLGRLLDQVAAIIDYGSKAEARPGTYTTRDGRPVEGHYVAIGGIYEGFVSTDGAVGAYRRKTANGWEWSESLPADRRDNLLKISRMLQGSEAPGFVPVPFGLVSGEPSGGEP